MTLDRGSKARLTPPLRDAFPGDTLFARIARAVCRAGCLPRKELFESWEVARRVRRRLRGGRVVELGAGHGLVSMLLLLLDDSSPRAVCYDRSPPPCFGALRRVLIAEWPRLAGRIDYRAEDLRTAPLAAGDLVVSVHACGQLTDVVIDRARAARCRLAVLPCCHDLDGNDSGGLEGWMDGALAVDAVRLLRLRDAGYTVHAARIPADITAKNRLLIARPPGSGC
jgi:hypothetical protein